MRRSPLFAALLPGVLVTVLALTVAGCGSDDGGGGKDSATGGQDTASGGKKGTGGESDGSGGADSTGGTASTGGSKGTGGSTGTGGTSTTSDVGKPGQATVAGGTYAKGKIYKGVFSLGDSPGGNTDSKSSEHSTHTGVVGASQK